MIDIGLVKDELEKTGCGVSDKMVEPCIEYNRLKRELRTLEKQNISNTNATEIKETKRRLTVERQKIIMISKRFSIRITL